MHSCLLSCNLTLLHCFFNVFCTVINFLTVFCTVFTPFFAQLFLPFFNCFLCRTFKMLTAIKPRKIVKRNRNEHGTQNYCCMVACFEKRELFCDPYRTYVHVNCNGYQAIFEFKLNIKEAKESSIARYNISSLARALSILFNRGVAVVKL